MKYTAINIGPIIPTFAMVRKPRELWAASFMFSCLMKCIIDKLPSTVTIISPATLDEKADKTVGLYPDRLFVKGEVDQGVINKALETFEKSINLKIKHAKEYFNVMRVVIDSEDEKEIIPKLNALLDRMELCDIHVNEDAREAIWKYLTAHNLEKVLEEKFENSSIETIVPINIFDGDDEKDDKKDKYICIVQADGDNMGKVIANLSMKEILFLSEELLNFGQKSCKLIRDYGGLPIYAGGDDLLFLAPVASGQKTIYDLIGEIDVEYQTVQKIICDKEMTTSMSYGISMTYYKFPLYEALAAARTLLFCTAKNVPGKNAIAWMLQKHSGSSFMATFSKDNPNLYAAFKKVIEKTEDDLLVSAVAHKLRSNVCLLSLWIDEEDSGKIGERLENFFKKIVDVETKGEAHRQYIDSVKELLMEAYVVADKLCMEKDSEEEESRVQAMSKQEKMEKVMGHVYGMLRTAKFIKGKEEDK